MALRLEKKDDNFYWCPKCKLFRWPKPPFLYPPSKEYNHWVGRISTLKMKRKMDKYVIEARIRLEEKVTIYSAENYNQEKLKSLVPKS